MSIMQNFGNNAGFAFYEISSSLTSPVSLLRNSFIVSTASQAAYSISGVVRLDSTKYYTFVFFEGSFGFQTFPNPNTPANAFTLMYLA
jgi:hypothetical protein